MRGIGAVDTQTSITQAVDGDVDNCPAGRPPVKQRRQFSIVFATGFAGLGNSHGWVSGPKQLVV